MYPPPSIGHLLTNRSDAQIRLKNDPPVPGLGEPFGIQGFATEQELDEYLLAHPNSTQAAYIFRFDESTIPRTYDWVLQVRHSGFGRFICKLA
jgi:hypothetical protein